MTHFGLLKRVSLAAPIPEIFWRTENMRLCLQKRAHMRARTCAGVQAMASMKALDPYA